MEQSIIASLVAVSNKREDNKKVQKENIKMSSKQDEMA